MEAITLSSLVAACIAIIGAIGACLKNSQMTEMRCCGFVIKRDSNTQEEIFQSIEMNTLPVHELRTEV